MNLDGKKVYIGEPTYHHPKHLGTYSQSEIQKDTDDLSDLVLDLIYPEEPTSIPLVSYRRENNATFTDFQYEFIPDKDLSTRWSNERAELKISHIQYLGHSAISNLFDIKTSTKIYKRNDEAEVISTDYLIEQMHGSAQNIALVKRADVAGRNHLVYEDMTNFDVYSLLNAILPVAQRIRLDLDEREFYDSRAYATQDQAGYSED